MITVTYNQITIKNALTRAFRQELVYDPSQTDPWYSRFTMTFEGLVTDLASYSDVHTRKMQVYCTSNVALTRREIWLDIRQALMDPRHPLRVEQLIFGPNGEVEPQVMFQCFPAQTAPDDPDRDVAHGPQPLNLEILGPIGTRALKISWQVQCQKLELPATPERRYHLEQGLGQLGVVLDNRWSVEEELDQDFYLTRTIHGSLRLSKPVSQLGLDYRWIVVPALEAGFKRQRLRYAVKEDGLSADYEVVDRQVHTAAPWPATRMEVRNTKRTQQGTKFGGQCLIRLLGPPHVSRRALIVRAVQILDALTGFLRKKQELQTFNWLPVNCEITENIGDVAEVQIILEYQYTPPTDQVQAQNFYDEVFNIGFDLKGLEPWPIPAAGPPPLDHYDPNLSWLPAPYGYNTWGGERDPAAVALFQCYLQRPYHPWHATGWWPAPAGAPEEVTRPEEPETLVQRVEDVPQPVTEGESKWSEDHRQAHYTYARMKSTYRIRKGRAQFLRLLDPTGVSQDQATAVVIQLGLGSAQRLIVVDAERYGVVPKIPAPVDYEDANRVKGFLVDWKVEILPPVTSPMGDELIYRVRARYLYALDRIPPLTQEAAPWPVGRLPHIADQWAGFPAAQAISEDLGPNPRRS
jgi:hypothetical protein